MRIHGNLLRDGRISIFTASSDIDSKGDVWSCALTLVGSPSDTDRCLSESMG